MSAAAYAPSASFGERHAEAHNSDWDNRSSVTFDNSQSWLVGRERHIESGYRLAETFQFQAAEVFHRNCVFYCGGDPTADQDLTILGLGAEPSGQVAHRSNCGVARSLGKADLPQ